MTDDPGAACPLCGQVAVGALGPHPDFSGSQLHACADCAFWFGAPPPSAEELRHHYETTYRQRRAGSISREYLALMRRRGAAQCRFIAPGERNIHTAWDIGCGVGALVLALAQAGVEAVGIDGDESIIRVGRARLRANVRTDYVSPAETAATERRDLLCLSHVVEHFADPVGELRSLLARVRVGGYVFVEVPNCTSWMFQQRVETESHLGFFTLRALEQLAKRLALEVVKLEGCGPVIEDYYHARAARQARESARGGRAVLARWLCLPARMAGRLRPPRTEFDGAFDTARAEGDEPRLWLRGLFRVPLGRANPTG